MHIKIIVSCEHASNAIPKVYQTLFNKHLSLLETHRGWDPGALTLAKRIAQGFRAPLFFGKHSRLLIDLNRSTKNRTLFSAITKALPTPEKEKIVHQYHAPYHQAIKSAIQKALQKKWCILHLSVHSFTHVLAKNKRYADMGLLYDPKHALEKKFCRQLREAILLEDHNLNVRMNYPYKGIQDSLTTSLRKLYNPQSYLGIELEINQKFLSNGKNGWLVLQKTMTSSLHQAYQQFLFQSSS